MNEDNSAIMREYIIYSNGTYRTRAKHGTLGQGKIQLIADIASVLTIVLTVYAVLTLF